MRAGCLRCPDRHRRRHRRHRGRLRSCRGRPASGPTSSPSPSWSWSIPALVPGPALVSAFVLNVARRPAGVAAWPTSARRPGPWPGRVVGTVVGVAVLAAVAAEDIGLFVGLVLLASVGASVSRWELSPTRPVVVGRRGRLRASWPRPWPSVDRRSPSSTSASTGPVLRATLARYFVVGTAFSLLALAVGGQFDGVGLRNGLAPGPGHRSPASPCPIVWPPCWIAGWTRAGGARPHLGVGHRGARGLGRAAGDGPSRCSLSTRVGVRIDGRHVLDDIDWRVDARAALGRPRTERLGQDDACCGSRRSTCSRRPAPSGSSGPWRARSTSAASGPASASPAPPWASSFVPTCTARDVVMTARARGSGALVAHLRRCRPGEGRRPARPLRRRRPGRPDLRHLQLGRTPAGPAGPDADDRPRRRASSTSRRRASTSAAARTCCCAWPGWPPTRRRRRWSWSPTTRTRSPTASPTASSSGGRHRRPGPAARGPHRRGAERGLRPAPRRRARDGRWSAPGPAERDRRHAETALT